MLWTVALGSTVVPDLDVIYNVLFRGFFNHSILWPHSLWPHLGLGLAWWALRRVGRWQYLQSLLGLAAAGGLSHLALDVFVHGTPLLYPFSMEMFDVVATRVVQGDVWVYLRAPIFLAEPLGSDVVLDVQTATALVGNINWETIASRAASGLWGGSASVLRVDGGSGLALVTVVHPIAGEPARFYRYVVRLAP